MAALDELNLEELVPETPKDVVKETISKLFWMWYTQNEYRELKTIKLWIFRKRIVVRDLKQIFELLFGAPAHA
jgi:hypothetical protein